MDQLETGSTSCRVLRAAGNGVRFQRQTGTGFASLLREGWAMKRSQELSWAQMLMAPNAAMLTGAALVQGPPGVGVLPVGQVVRLIDDNPSAAELIERIMREAGETLKRLKQYRPLPDLG